MMHALTLEHADQVPPCPHWCTQDEGHRFDSVPPGTTEQHAVIRHHRRDVAQGITVAQQETRVGLSVFREPATVELSCDSDLQPSEALRFAAALKAAALLARNLHRFHGGDPR